MTLPPRPPDEHVITPAMWITVGLVGLVMAIGTLLVLDASLPGGLIQGMRDSAWQNDGLYDTCVVSTIQRFQLPFE